MEKGANIQANTDVQVALARELPTSLQAQGMSNQNNTSNMLELQIIS